MKLTDKYFMRFLGMSLICGLLTFLLIAAIWYGMSQVSWFHEYWIGAIIVVCWGIGAIVGWLVTPCDKKSNVWLRCYQISVAAYLVGTILFGSWDDSSVSGWSFMFIIGYAVVSFPLALILGLVCEKIFKLI